MNGQPGATASRRGILTGLAVIPLVIGSLAGCQPRTAQRVQYPEAVRYAAERDSLGLAAFAGLPAGEAQARRDEAETWRARALQAETISEELQALRTATGLDPGDAASWLRLAKRTRWYGDYTQTEDALVACRRALPLASTRNRHIAAAAAVCASWLRYDRGEWKRGLAWADSAAASGADADEVQLLRALHLAGIGRNYRAEDIAHRFAQRDHRPHWIYGVSYWRRGGAQPAHGIFTGTASAISSDANDFVKGQMRPTTVHAAEAYRDFGTVEEMLGNWWVAEQQYEFSAGFVPDIERADVVRRDVPPLARGAKPLPVWLAFDRFFVTGSLSGYVNLAFQRFEAATEPVAREFWATAVVDAAGSLVRLDVDQAWARRARGLVLARYEGKQVQARTDLAAAWRWFESHRVDDLPTVTTLAHLFLQANRPARARPLLERATEIAPDHARSWSDLGLAYIHLGEVEPAMAALERALILDETLAVAWYNRGLLRYHLEDLTGAVSDLERAHQLAPDDPDIEGLLEQLRRRLPRP